MDTRQTVSVIIPTYNRSTSLRRTLDALCNQTYAMQRVEVIVVMDGCTDETAEMLRHWESPYALTTIHQANQGPAAARNCGAAQARGHLLIFLDDDVQPTPSLTEAHVQAHSCTTDRVVIGYLPPVIQGPANYFRIELRNWWEAMFRPMRRPFHRYGYWNMLSGNLSLAAEQFACAGGFDPVLRCHEDYELGIRLIKAGASLTFASNAVGYHHEVTDLDRSLWRKRQEGQADVMIGRRYPESLPSMPLYHFQEPWSPLTRRLRTLAFTHPAAGDKLATGLRRSLDMLEQMRLSGRWRRLLYALLDYWYWRGVAGELGSRRALADFVQSTLDAADNEDREIELDLQAGLEAAEQRLDVERPASACIRYGQQPVGRIVPQPGAERLRGYHLRPILANELSRPLLKALALDRVFDEVFDPQCILTELARQEEMHT
jgi:glycosyltransferase involved in cell wall biosynthesis